MTNTLTRSQRNFSAMAGEHANAEMRRTQSGAPNCRIACRECVVSAAGTRWSTKLGQARGLGQAPTSLTDVMDAWIIHRLNRHEGEPLPPACTTEFFQVERVRQRMSGC